MKYKVKDKNKYTKEVTCTVPWDDLKDSFNDEFNRAKANHTPQNGRKGKVFGTALEIFKKNYTPAIEATFAEKALNEYYQKILIETGLQPINRANPTDLKFKQGEELSFVLDFEVLLACHHHSYPLLFFLHHQNFHPISCQKLIELLMN